MKTIIKFVLSIVLLSPAMVIAMEEIATLSDYQNFTNPDEEAAAFMQQPPQTDKTPLTTDQENYFGGPAGDTQIQPNNAPYTLGDGIGAQVVHQLRTKQGKEQQTPTNKRSLYAQLNWLKKYWVPLATGTVSLAYCGYIAYKDKQALPEAFSWAKSQWAAIPKLLKPLAFGIGFLGVGSVTCKTYNYFFRKPILTNSSTEGID